MPVLQYDISVIGVQNVERAMASIEKRFAAHNARLVSASNKAATAAGVRGPSGRTASASTPDKEMAAAARAAASLDRQRSAALYRQYQAKERLEAKAQRDALRNIETRARAEARAAVSAQREFRRRTGAVVGRVGQSLGGIGKAALAVTGLGGGALIASRLGGAAALEKAQRGIAIQGKQNGKESPLSYEQIRDAVSNTAIATGTNQEDVTAGFAKYVSKTGDVKGASENLKTFATVASAAGASVEDVASAAAALSESMDIKSAEDMQKALAGIYYQGKKGAFELKDMAGHLSMLASQASSLGITGLTGMRTLGGLTQIAMKGTGDPAEAATAAKDALSELVAKGGKLQSGAALGGKKVKVFTDANMTKVGDVRNAFAETIAKGNLPQLEEIFGKRGISALNPMISGAKNAAAAAGGGAKGEAAAKQYVLKAIEESSDAMGTFKDVQGDMGDAMKSVSAQLERLNSQLTSAVQSQLLPELVKLAPHIVQLVPLFSKMVGGLAKFIDFLATNPYTGIGAIILGKITADLAAAGIGSGVRSVLMSIVSGIAAQGGIASAGANAVMGGATAVGGKLGLGAAGTAALGAGVAGAGALAGAGAAGYQAYKLYEETKASGGVWQNIQDAFKAPAAPVEGADYDRMTAKVRRPASAAGGPDRDVAAMNMKAAQMNLEAARVLAGKADQPNRGNSPSPVK